MDIIDVIKTKEYNQIDQTQNSDLRIVTILDGYTYLKRMIPADEAGNPIEGSETAIDTDALEFEFEESEFTLDELNEKIANAKSEKCSELNKFCDSLITSFKSSATGKERIYDSDIEDQLNIIALVAAGVDSYFRCSTDGVHKENVKHTAEQMKAVFADGLKYKSTIIGICGILKSYVESQIEIMKNIVIEDPYLNNAQNAGNADDAENAENIENIESN